MFKLLTRDQFREGVFVIDIARTPTGYKVIEYNTFNSAGLYACPPKSIVTKINTYVESL